MTPSDTLEGPRPAAPGDDDFLRGTREFLSRTATQVMGALTLPRVDGAPAPQDRGQDAALRTEMRLGPPARE